MQQRLSRSIRRAIMMAGILTPSARAQTVDSAAARLAVSEFGTACRRDHGALWGVSLCGPIVVADPASRFAVASQLPPDSAFRRQGTVFVGQLPADMPLANTSVEWGGRRWATVLLPLPADRFTRIALMAHESFHRIQPTLGLWGTDPLNPHLDERDGRYWLRLELRALAAALWGTGAPGRAAARDALLFRARRHQLYPGADTLETALERQEGLAEYTGVRIALRETGAPLSRVADDVQRFEGRTTYVRSLGYGTGPVLGLLLDRYDTGWRGRMKQHGLATELARALRFVPPSDPAEPAAARAGSYEAARLAAAEDAREVSRQSRLSEFRSQLVTGPVLVLEQPRLSRSFNPNTLVPLRSNGTVYPTGAFGAEWGSLDVTAGGALVAGDFRSVRVALPADTTAGSTIHGSGWTLTLAPGWHLRPGGRAGDLAVGH